MLKHAIAFTLVAVMELVVLVEGARAQPSQGDTLPLSSLLYGSPDPFRIDDTLMNEAFRTGCQAISAKLYSEAEKSLQIAIQEAERLSIDDNLRVEAAIWITLAKLCQGKTQEAIRDGATCLHDVMQAGGSKNVRWAMALTALGEKCVDANLHKQAYAYYRNSVIIYRNALGKEHTAVAEMDLKLAWLDLANYNDARAETFAREALTILERSRPERSYEIAKSWNLIGVSCRNQGKLAEAESCFQKALRITEKDDPTDCCAAIITLTNLGHVLCMQQRANEAEPLLVRAIELLEKDPQKSEKYQSRTNFVMARIFENKKMYGNAEQYYRNGLESFLKHGELDHTEAIAYMDSIARILRLQGRNAEADEMESRAKKSRKEFESAKTGRKLHGN